MVDAPTTKLNPAKFFERYVIGRDYAAARLAQLPPRAIPNGLLESAGFLGQDSMARDGVTIETDESPFAEAVTAAPPPVHPAAPAEPPPTDGDILQGSAVETLDVTGTAEPEWMRDDHDPFYQETFDDPYIAAAVHEYEAGEAIACVW